MLFNRTGNDCTFYVVYHNKKMKKKFIPLLLQLHFKRSIVTCNQCAVLYWTHRLQNISIFTVSLTTQLCSRNLFYPLFQYSILSSHAFLQTRSHRCSLQVFSNTFNILTPSALHFTVNTSTKHCINTNFHLLFAIKVTKQCKEKQTQKQTEKKTKLCGLHYYKLIVPTIS